MHEISTEAITLKSIPFKESDRILTIFTKETGIISLMAKNLRIKKNTLFSLSSPFCQSTIIYRKGKGEIHTLIDFSIQNENLSLRKQLSFITSASEIVQTILKSQLSQKNSTSLYLLLDAYLKQIPSFINPSILSSSFILKLLSHEGLIHLTEKCNLCNEQTLSLLHGESLCAKHSKPLFSLEEFQTLFILTYTKSFADLKNLEITNDLKKKIHTLFQERILS